MAPSAQSGQVRDACDRCHAIKTRCVRIEADRPVCQRCDRLRLPCCYSPPGQTGRPRGGRKRKDLLSSPPAEPDLPASQEATDGSERGRDQADPIISAAGALPTPEASTVLHDTLQLVSSDLCHQDTSFGMEDFSISPWPDFAPDVPPAGAEVHDVVNPLFQPQHAVMQNFYPGDTGTHIALATSHDTSHRHLMQLADLQSRLLSLVQSVSESTDCFSSIEEILIASENLIALFEASGPACQTMVSPGMTVSLTPTQEQNTKTGQSVVLLLSSCYLILMNIFETLVAQLQAEQGSQTVAEKHGYVVQCSLVSIGSTRMSLTRQAAAEVHLHLVFRMFDKLASGLRVYGGTNAEGSTTQSIVSLAGMAVHSLGAIEERITEKRSKAKFTIES